jgi:hypothetical protein
MDKKRKMQVTDMYWDHNDVMLQELCPPMLIDDIRGISIFADCEVSVKFQVRSMGFHIERGAGIFVSPR